MGVTTLERELATNPFLTEIRARLAAEQPVAASAPPPHAAR
jgi:hypothetical protein